MYRSSDFRRPDDPFDRLNGVRVVTASATVRSRRSAKTAPSPSTRTRYSREREIGDFRDSRRSQAETCVRARAGTPRPPVLAWLLLSPTGRDEHDFTWERTEKAGALRTVAGLGAATVRGSPRGLDDQPGLPPGGSSIWATRRSDTNMWSPRTLQTTVGLTPYARLVTLRYVGGH